MASFQDMLTPQAQRMFGYDRTEGSTRGKVDTVNTVPMGRVQPAHMGSQSEVPGKEND